MSISVIQKINYYEKYPQRDTSQTSQYREKDLQVVSKNDVAWFERADGVLVSYLFVVVLWTIANLFGMSPPMHYLLPLFAVWLTALLDPVTSIKFPSSASQLVTCFWLFFGGAAIVVYLPLIVLGLILNGLRRIAIKLGVVRVFYKVLTSISKGIAGISLDVKILYVAVAVLFVMSINHGMMIHDLEWRQDVQEQRLNVVEENVEFMKKQIGDILEKIKGIELQIGKIIENNKEIVKKLDELSASYSNFVENTFVSAINKIHLDAVAEHTYVVNIENTLIQIHGHRTWYRLGCLPAGTRIVVDKLGNTLPVEMIKEGSMIYSAHFGGELSVKLSRAGPETGFLYEISLSDGSKANVTSGHAMLVESFHSTSGLYEKAANVAAKEVKVGDQMTSINGKQSVVGIRLIPVERLAVYNFMLELPDSADVLSRVVVVNGIYMLDLHAQELLAPVWQQYAAYLVSFIL